MKKVYIILILLSLLAAQLTSQSLDISGYKIVQANSSITLTIPPGTKIQPGGYVVIGRNNEKAAFETAWGVTLGANVVYINGFSVVGGNGFPVINGAENYTLQNASGTILDGPTISMTVGKSYQRKSITGSASSASSWDSVAQASATPGSGIINTNSGKLIISEFSDAPAFANEFVELYYDVTPPPTGQGKATVSPSRWKYNVPTTLQFAITSQSDTIRAIRFIMPSVVLWNKDNIFFPNYNAFRSVNGDTVTITNIGITPSDTLPITITHVTAIDSTDEFEFKFSTGKDSVTLLPIQLQPKTLVYGTPRPMAQIKRKEPNGVHSLLGKWAVAKGIVTVANEFGGPSYVQDKTAAIALFDSSVSNHIERGDEVLLLGFVAPFNDLFEFAPCVLLEKVSEGNSVDTLVLTAAQILAQGTAEPDEGKLIRINGIASVTTTAGLPATSWATTGSGTNYKISDATGTTEIRISSRTNIANTPTPTGAFDVVGVLGQFLTNYQILPRSIDDIIPEGNGPRFTSIAPYEKHITPTSITLEWKTDVPGSSKVRYGKTTAYGFEVSDTTQVTNHAVTLTGLEPATIYNIQFESANNAGTTLSANYIVSTASLTSTGTINVYFNKSVKSSLARGENATIAKFDTILIRRINTATYSIDAALYSFSGTVGANVASALVAAKNRGVKVRVIGEKDNQSTAPWTTLKNNGITVIDDGFDAVNAGTGLMHNKFVIIDNRDTTSDTDDWVWTGSWNVTDPGTTADAQNVIEIQDKALANAYTREFEEMWGSSTDAPNATTSRFGARKFDNTPHLFNIKGTPVELYFSPSDRTNGQIINALNRARSSVSFALLTFTRSDIANALTSKKQTGIKVRGVMDNKTDQGSQFDTLKARGIDLFLKANLTGLLHHKYAVIDPESNDSLQYVITGSHNWSSSAENSNNENTLIIRSRRIANLYIQEFGQRYTDAGGSDPILFVAQSEHAAPQSFSLRQNYPNPFNPTTTIEFSLSEQSHTRLTIYDVLGREIATLINDRLPSGNYSVLWNAATVASGVYFYRLEAGKFIQTKKLLLQK